MIKVHDAGGLEDRLAKITQSINRSPVIFPFTAIGSSESAGTTTGLYGGIAVDRAWLRTLAPDARWVVRAAGRVDPADANGVTVSLVYQDDSSATTVLASSTFTGAGVVKATIGPADVFATVGVPAGESIPVIRLTAQKITSGTATLGGWTIWLELRTARD